jgi:hypothetical protein
MLEDSRDKLSHVCTIDAALTDLLTIKTVCMEPKRRSRSSRGYPPLRSLADAPTPFGAIRRMDNGLIPVGECDL